MRTQQNLHICVILGMCLCVRVCACSGCTYCAAETAWLKTNWQKTFEAEKRGKNVHTQQPVKSEMPLIFLSSASRLTRRERSAPTLLLQTTRDRDGVRKRRGDGRKREGWETQTEHLICLFPIWNHSTHLTFYFLSRLWSFAPFLHRPLFPTSDSRRTKCIFVSVRGGRVIST